MSIDIVDILNKAVIGLKALGDSNPGPDIVDLAAAGVGALRDVIVAVTGAGIRHVTPAEVQGAGVELEVGLAQNRASADAVIDEREAADAATPTDPDAA